MKEERQNQTSLDSTKKTLVDYVISHYSLASHLEIVAKFLKNEYDFMDMLEHAKNLREVRPLDKQNIDIISIITQFNEEELKVVGGYMRAVGNYSCGKGNFESVDALASQLIRLIPIPDTIYAPPGSFPEDLARAREEV